MRFVLIVLCVVALKSQESFITQFEYGLTRTKTPNTDESYYYVPAAMFLGNVEYRYQNTGEIFYFQEDVPLLLLNAVDGTVIPLENE